MMQDFKAFCRMHPDESNVSLVYKYLYGKIVGLELHPGEKLNLANIAKQLSVSRITVRDAVLKLVDANLVAPLEPDRGFQVAKLNFQEMFQLYHVRRILESEAVQELCEIVTREQIDQLLGLNEKIRGHLRERDFKQFSHTDMEFHRSLVNFTRNPYLIMAYQSIGDTMDRHLRYSIQFAMPQQDDVFIGRLIRFHDMIIQAIDHNLPMAAMESISRHLMNALQVYPFYDNNTFRPGLPNETPR